LRPLAIALSAPTIFYGVLGVGSTLIVWWMIRFDPLRLDFYLSVFAAAGPVTFLLRLLGLRRRWLPSRAVAVLLNLACVACAVLVALLRHDTLSQPILVGVLLLLSIGPALNAAVLLTDPGAAD
jgi:hypothetical protein